MPPRGRPSSAGDAESNCTTGDVILAKDIDGRLTYANPATLELIGKPPNEVAGSKVADFLSDKDSALRVKDNDRRIVDSGVGEDEGATWPQSRCQRSTVGCRRDSAPMAWYQFARQLRGDQLNAACVSSGSEPAAR